MNIKEMRSAAGMSQQKFGDYLHIPKRTIQDWEAGIRQCPPYVVELIEFKLRHEHIITDEL